MFKRAVITDEISQDLSQALKIMQRFELEGVELRSVWEKNPHEWDKEQLNQIKSKIAAAGMQTCCLAAPVFKCKLGNEAEYQQHLNILERSMEVANELGANLVRGFTFWDNGRFDEALPEIVEKIGATESLLQKNGITLVIESDPATAANSSQRLERVLQQIASPNIKALWDPGNNLYVPDAEQPFPEGYERLKSYIGHIHVKDVSHDPLSGAAEACSFGKGEVGFANVFTRLKADQYNGWLSLETHYRIRGALSEDLLALPKGSAFSIGGAEATSEALENWDRILRSLR